jgi:MYXO-CTERM domain-containing protein
MAHPWLGLVALASLVGLARPAAANGRFPRAERLIEDAQDPNHLVLAATYGLVVTADRGKSWFHVCEGAFAEPGQQTDPVVALMPDGGLLTSIFRSFSRSTDGGCDFQRRLGGDPSQAVPDFTIDGDGKVVAMLVSGASTLQLQESSDGGQQFHPLGSLLPDSLRVVATVDVAPSDPSRVYVSGFGLNSVGVLLRSDDRGKSFTTLPLPTNAASDEVPFIAAVDPQDPDVLYVRTDVWIYDESSGVATAGDALLYSDDGGEHFTELLRKSGKLLGFALSPDNKELLVGYGDPVEGGGRNTEPDALGIYQAPVGSSDFVKVASNPVSCLTWTALGIYACTGQAQLGFTLGLAQPDSLKAQGTSAFSPLLSLKDVKGPLSCTACASGARCADFWQASCEAWGRTDCEALSSSAGGAAECGPTADAGAAGATGMAGEPASNGGSDTSGAPTSSGGMQSASMGGASGGGVPAPAKPETQSGCGCRTAGNAPNPSAVACALAGLAWLRRRRGRALLVACLALGGCSGKGDPNPSAAPAPTSMATDCSGDFDTFEPGMTKLAKPGQISVELAEATPSPPVVRDDNTWRLKLTDADGEPVVGATLVATPYMPQHQHGTAEVVIEEQGDGAYVLSPIELIMPGVWEIPLSVTTADGALSETTFRFCIAER